MRALVVIPEAVVQDHFRLALETAGEERIALWRFAFFFVFEDGAPSGLQQAFFSIEEEWTSRDRARFILECYQHHGYWLEAKEIVVLAEDEFIGYQQTLEEMRRVEEEGGNGRGLPGP